MKDALLSGGPDAVTCSRPSLHSDEFITTPHTFHWPGRETPWLWVQPWPPHGHLARYSRSTQTALPPH